MSLETSFSVVIPMFNCEEYIEYCLESVLSQSYGLFEVIVIDDGSTDSSASIVDGIVRRDDRVLLVRTENHGRFAARCEGIRRSNGEFIVFLDSDDALRADALHILSTVLRETPDATVVTFGFSRDPDFRTQGARLGLEAGVYLGDSLSAYFKEICRGLSNNVCMKAIHRSLFQDLDSLAPFSAVMHGEDLLMVLHSVVSARCVIVLDEPLYFYRTNLASATHNYVPRQLDDISLVMDELIAFGHRLGKKYSRAVDFGVGNQYAHLVKILAGSRFDKQAYAREARRIAGEIRRRGVAGRALRAPARLDNCLLLVLMNFGFIRAARLLLAGIGHVKGLR